MIYELHVGTFTPRGTFLALVDRLEHLRELGVTGLNFSAPHHHYGTPNELKQLGDAGHQAGLAVILDVVYNHLGPSGNFLHRFGPDFTDRHHTGWGWVV